MCQDVFKREVEREKPFDFYIYKSRKAYQDDLQAQKNGKKVQEESVLESKPTWANNVS